MTTPRILSLVSLATGLVFAVAAGGCVSTPSRVGMDEPAPTEAPPPVVRFDNEDRDYVRVYLVGTRQEWLLGRVAPGARATLIIPEAALAENAGPMWLAVLARDRLTLRAADDARATTTIAQPVAAILSQRWTFSHLTAAGELTPLRLGPSRSEVGRP